jgi:hypothetical protein
LAILVAGVCMPYQNCFAQTGKLDSLLKGSDSTRIMDSIYKGMDQILDSMLMEKSFVTGGVGLSNRSFSIRNQNLNSQEAVTDVLSITPNIGYYHKKGLGLSVTSFLSGINNRYTFYQYAVTPSYDYINKKFTAGISYTRYFAKDTSVLSVSPYDNDFYGFFNLRRKSWRLGIAAGFANGSISDKMSYTDSVLRYNIILQKWKWVKYIATVNSFNKINDFSLSLSVRKDFDWYHVLFKEDNLSLNLNGFLTGGSSQIKTNSQLTATRKKITLARFNRIFDSSNGSGFQAESMAFSLSIYYSIGKFNILPMYYISYFFPDTDKKVNQVFSMMLAFDF